MSYPNFTSDQVRAYTEIRSYLYEEGLCQLYHFMDQYLIPDLNRTILSYLKEDDLTPTNEPLCLIGSAGTGKTYLTCTLLRELAESPKNNIYVLAPTHKARHNLAQMFHTDIYPNIHFRTLASFLKMTLEYEPSGNSYFVSKLKEDDLNDLCITHIFIDEVSMIKTSEWEDIKAHVIRKLQKCKVILVGDDHQLPPVMEEKSIVFEEVTRKIVLHEIIRTEKSDLLRFYKGLRGFVDGAHSHFPFSVYRSQDVMLLPQFPASILKMSFDPNKDKIVAYRNKTVDAYTQMVRKILYDDPEEEVVKGERLMFQHYYLASDNVPFYPSYEFTVDNVRIVYKKVGGKECKMYEITHRDHVFYKIHPDDRSVFETFFGDWKMKIKRAVQRKNLKKKETSAMWKEFYDKKNYFDVPVTYAYALTVHKSQGSTYRKVFLDVQDLECVRYIDLQQYKHALYTAGTRASERLMCKS